MTRSELNLSAVRAVLFDMDGVLYVGARALPGVQAMLDYLDATKRRWLCVTNNASMTSTQFSEKLAKMDIRVAPERILGSSQATAAWLSEQILRRGWPRGKVIVLGMSGLRTALTEQGFELTSDPFDAAYAVAGIHLEMTYRDLTDVALAIRNGARFIGTNGDVTLPTERGLTPGAGSLLAALVAATDVEPTIIGKPHMPMYELAMERLGAYPHSTLMVGDRYDTDIAGALALGMSAAAVLTGVNTREQFAASTPPPQLIVDGLPQLQALLAAADKTSQIAPD